MPRRIVAVALGLVLVLGASVLVRLAGSPGPRRPDVVVIAIDTLRGDHLGCLGSDWVRTPHLDALARDGVLFTRCLATAPWTLPSFASIFTGLTVSHHGVVGGRHEVLHERFVTMAEHLNSAGYRSHGFSSVKWLTSDFGMTQGFGLEPPPPGAALGAGGAEDATRLGLATFGLPRDRPLFTFLHYFDVHAPYPPPPPFARMYYEGDERAPGTPVKAMLLSDANLAPNKSSGIYDWLEGVTDLEYPRREYGAAVSYVDAIVGRLMAGLKESGRYDDALVMVVADHGEHLGEHDLWFTHTLPYQETLRVPLLVKLPRARHAGRVIDEPVSTLDILPSLLDWLRLPAAATDGRSLRSLVAGRDSDGRSLLVAEQGSDPRALCKSLVEWPLKLMLFRDRAGDRYALFDLETDPGETTDLSRDRPADAARLRARLWEVFDPRRALGNTPLARPAIVDAGSRDLLRSLGYVAGHHRSEADGPAIPVIGGAGSASSPAAP